MLQACQAVVLAGTPWSGNLITTHMKGVKQNWDTEKCLVDLGSLGYGLLGHRGPEHADHRLIGPRCLPRQGSQGRHLEWTECSGRRKTRKDGRGGAKPSFILLEIDLMPNRHGCRPLACSSASSFTHTPPSGAWPVSAKQPELLILTRSPSTASHPGWSRSRPGSQPLETLLPLLRPRLLSFRGIAVSGSYLPIPIPTQLDGTTAILGLGQ